jgi:hypothetical protein
MSVRRKVPVTSFESLNLYNEQASRYANKLSLIKNTNLAVNVDTSFGMIRWTKGDILSSGAEALVNTVNTVA